MSRESLLLPMPSVTSIRDLTLQYEIKNTPSKSLLCLGVI